MKRAFFHTLLVAALTGPLLGQDQTTSSTPPIGFIRKDCPANSDTRVSIPLERQSVHIGPISGATGNVLDVKGSPGWEVDQFKNSETQSDHYYVTFLSGANEGRHFDVTANGADTLTLDLGNGELAGVVDGDRIKLLPHWTLDTAFPEGKGIITSDTPLNPNTEVLVQETEAVGTNFAPADTFFYFNGWNRIGNFDGTDGGYVIRPHSYITVRNPDSDTTPVFVGVVALNSQKVAIRVPAGGTDAKQDNHLALDRPVPMKLRDSNLVESGAFAPSTFPLNPTDVLLVYDDEEIAINKSASKSYFYWNGAWRKIGPDFDQDSGDDEIFTVGTGVVLRKSGEGNASEEIIYWTHHDPTN